MHHGRHFESKVAAIQRLRINIIVLFFALLAAGNAADGYNFRLTQTEKSDEFVIILHGLRGSSRSFLKMQKVLSAQGFSVCLVDYPSTRDSLGVLADSAIAGAVRLCRQAGAKKIDFVAHSMGAILVRYYLRQKKIPELGRVVLLSPPNHGTEVVDAFAWSALFRKFNGPAGMAIGAAPDGLVQSLGPPDYEVGVIMSTRSINPLASLFISGKDDGRVSIESAKLEGMKDFALVSSNHHVIMKKEKTIEKVVQFLKYGTFR